MKKFSTLGFGILISLASFASFAPSRLTVATEGNANIKVTIDGNRFSQQSFNSSVVFENLQPGYHAVNVYQLTEKRGMFGRRVSADYRLVYTASVNIRPAFATTIQVNRFGRAQVMEQAIRGYDDRNRGRDDNRKDDRGYNNNSGYDRNNSYDRTITDVDFYAAQRVMDRENDNGRLLYAKRIVDDNFLSAEQVKDLAKFFSLDKNRLEFAKYAYSKTTDKDNFNIVCSAFYSSYSKDQLMNYVKNCR